MTGLPDKIIAIHRALERAGIAHGFGGALALAWCTERARGTIDIDLNIFAEVDRAADALAALPSGVAWSDVDREAIEQEGQVRVWWDTTPVDIFMNTTEFHTQAARRAQWHDFGGVELPFLSCADVGVFKAFFNRTKDWADLEEMQAAGTLDLDRVVGVLVRYLGPDDARVERVRQLG